MTILQPKFMIPIALIAGLLATLGAYKFLDARINQAEKENNAVKKVVVAKTNLGIGVEILPHMVEISEWPKDIIPNGTFDNIESLIHRVVKIETLKGEAILAPKLAPAGSAGGFSSLIPPGMRAMTVSVNVVSGVSGFILPNTKVDVMVTVLASNKREDATTKIILEDILVLAVDQTFETKDDDPQTVQSVTLLVTPEQTEILALAATEGKLMLTLRNSADLELIPTTGIKLKELVNKPAPVRRYRPSTRTTTSQKTATPEPAPQIQETEHKVEVIRSTERSEVSFKEKKNGDGQSPNSQENR